jgi:UDPglucose 6-dehydrogenase
MMIRPQIGVVGAGVVGTAMQKLFGAATTMYDPKPGYSQDKHAINGCDVAFVCVPTPMRADGTCNTSMVEDTIAWVEAPLIIIRSTVSPGTTDRLRDEYGKHIVFQPEYLGETPAHVFGDMADRAFTVLGGSIEDTSRAADVYKHYHNAMMRFYFCDAVTAEVAKYMENAFYAVKVIFVNEFYDIARACHVDFNVLREIWLADPRISRDHTFVYPDARGFSGKCLPKDVNAIVAHCRERGFDPRLLRATLAINEVYVTPPPRKSDDLGEVAVTDGPSGG